MSYAFKEMEIIGIFPKEKQDELQRVSELNLPINSFEEYECARNLSYKDLLTNPILDIAARVWEEDRYEAAQICYRSMRMIDNLVDHSKTEGNVSDREKRKITIEIEEWLNGITESNPHDSHQKELLNTIKRFQIPLWPWQRFVKAMIYDINHDGYGTFSDFLNYAEGASISPASIFMHLVGVNKNNGSYITPQFDVRKIARPAALFAYLVHIIRDFEKDQKNNLNYFAQDLMKKYGVDNFILRDIACGGNITSGFRKLMGRYYEFADYYRRKTLQSIEMALPYLESRYMLSLSIIYDLYLQIFERIDPANGRFTTSELNPTPNEIKYRLNLLLNDNGFW